MFDTGYQPAHAGLVAPRPPTGIGSRSRLFRLTKPSHWLTKPSNRRNAVCGGPQPSWVAPHRRTSDRQRTLHLSAPFGTLMVFEIGGRNDARLPGLPRVPGDGAVLRGFSQHLAEQPMPKHGQLAELTVGGSRAAVVPPLDLGRAEHAATFCFSHPRTARRGSRSAIAWWRRSTNVAELDPAYR